MNITLYTKNNCVQCTQTKKWLDKNNLPYTIVNVEENMDAYDYVVNHLEYKAAPVIIVEDNEENILHWSGFNPEKLQNLL